MKRLNLTFRYGRIADVGEMNSLTRKVDEIVDALNSGDIGGGAEGGGYSGLREVYADNDRSSLVIVKVGDKEDDGSQSISATPKIVKITDATSQNDGLATANDVKEYIGEVADKVLFYDNTTDVVAVIEQVQSPKNETLRVVQI